jgi:integrase/recombinase XerD
VKRPLLVLSPADVARLADRIRGNSSTAIRSRALLMILQRAGVRPRECCRLREADCNLVDATLRITGSKRNRSRLIGMSPAVGAAVADWINRRAKLGITHAPLFCALSGAPWDSGAIRVWLRRLARRAGVEGRVVPYSLRHGFAVHLVRNGASLQEVAAAMGHHSIRTTFLYLQSLGATSALDVVRRVAW